MDGRIWVDSKLGEGSTFHITATLESAPEPSVTEADFHILRGSRVLVADDNETNRLILRRHLSPFAAGFDEAADGESALAEVRRAAQAGEPYALAILDYRMPVLDGLEVVARLRQDSLTA